MFAAPGQRPATDVPLQELVAIQVPFAFCAVHAVCANPKAGPKT
ncbi:unnamed protein product, partial [Rotaria socialis]